MSFFNKTNQNRNKTTNKEGFPAYSRNDFRQDLIMMVFTSVTTTHQFYQRYEEKLNNIADYMQEHPEDVDFAVKTMIFARNELNLRTIAHILAFFVAPFASGRGYLRKAYREILVRPDDALEIVAIFNQAGVKVPNSLRRAIRDRLERGWDAYQLRKYFGSRNAVKVSDLIKLAHPRATELKGREDIFHQALNGTLPAIDTAQTTNSAVTDEKERSEQYINMIYAGKLGYMALLKNLNHILRSDMTESEMQIVQTALINEDAIKKSRVLPFRIVQAYDAVNNYVVVDRFIRKRIMTSLEIAFTISSGNLQLIPKGETVALMLDESASMGSGQKSPFYYGKVLTATMAMNMPPENIVTYLWANNARYVEIGQPLPWIGQTSAYGGGTNLSSAINKLVEEETHPNYIFVFTDMQENSRDYYSNDTFYQTLEKYRKDYNPNVKVIFWNLAGYDGGIPTPLNDKNLEISGMSDTILKVIPDLIKDQKALVKKVDSIELAV